MQGRRRCSRGKQETGRSAVVGRSERERQAGERVEMVVVVEGDEREGQWFAGARVSERARDGGPRFDTRRSCQFPKWPGCANQDVRLFSAGWLAAANARWLAARPPSHPTPRRPLCCSPPNLNAVTVRGLAASSSAPAKQRLPGLRTAEKAACATRQISWRLLGTYHPPTPSRFFSVAWLLGLLG